MDLEPAFRGIAASCRRDARPRRPRILRSTILWLTLGTLAVLLSACSQQTSGAPGSSGKRPVGPATSTSLNTARAAISTTTRESVAVSYVLAGAQVFGTAPAPVTGSGGFDLASGLGQAVLHQPSGKQLLVLTPTVVFTRVPPGGAAALPRGKTWMSASLTGSESLATNFPQFVVQVEGFNPLLYLDEAAWGAESAAPLGSRDIAGEPARGYLVEVDLAAAMSRATGPSAASIGLAIRSEIASAGSGTANPGAVVVPVRFWVNSAGRVVAIEGSPPGAGVGTTFITLTSPGAVVRVVRPLTSKVVDIASLTPSGERENNGGGDSDGA